MAQCPERGEEREEDRQDDGDEEDAEAPLAPEGGPAAPLRRRAVCSGCGRPSSVCLCAAFPAVPLQLPSDLRSVLLLRHPKERRQKHQSAWILERCVAGIRQHLARRLSPQDPPAGLEFIYEQPASCILVFPAQGAKPLCEVLHAGARHLIFVDATWRFAKEMVAASEPLAALRCAVLTPPPGTRPVFVVRKPLLLPPAEGGGAEGTAAGGPGGAEEERWGYSTAEAVGLALDEVQRLRSDSAPLRGYYPAVARALGAYARKQLERTTAPRARPERPGYIPRLYEESAVAPEPGASPLSGAPASPWGRGAGGSGGADAGGSTGAAAAAAVPEGRDSGRGGEAA